MMPKHVIDGNQLIELLQDEESLRVSRTTCGYWEFAVRIEYGLSDYIEVSYGGGQTFIVRSRSDSSAFGYGLNYTVDQILDIIL